MSNAYNKPSNSRGETRNLPKSNNSEGKPKIVIVNEGANLRATNIKNNN